MMTEIARVERELSRAADAQSVGVVVRAGNRFAMVEECFGPLSICCGHCHPGERVATAAVRESREELGIVIEPSELRLLMTEVCSRTNCGLRRFTLLHLDAGEDLTVQKSKDQHSAGGALLSLRQIRLLPLRKQAHLTYLELAAAGWIGVPLAAMDLPMTVPWRAVAGRGHPTRTYFGLPPSLHLRLARPSSRPATAECEAAAGPVNIAGRLSQGGR